MINPTSPTNPTDAMRPLRARYASRCAACGGRIAVGEDILYSRATGARHARCAGAPTPSSLASDSPTWAVIGGSGYGDTPYVVGAVIANPGRRIGSSRSRAERPRVSEWSREVGQHPAVIAAREAADLAYQALAAVVEDDARTRRELAARRAPSAEWEAALAPVLARSRARRDALAAAEDALTTARQAAQRELAGGTIPADLPDDDGPEYLVVLDASQRYYREDGMSFGVGDESGHVYQATVRAATDEESAPLRTAARECDRRRLARQALEDVAREIVEAGERPEGWHEPAGEVVPIGEGQTIYGGGQWFVLGPEWIWYVRNNGADGDDWSLNNIRTGGAGAIGWRGPARAEVAARIRGAALEQDEQEP